MNDSTLEPSISQDLTIDKENFSENEANQNLVIIPKDTNIDSFASKCPNIKTKSDISTFNLLDSKSIIGDELRLEENDLFSKLLDELEEGTTKEAISKASAHLKVRR